MIKVYQAEVDSLFTDPRVFKNFFEFSFSELFLCLSFTVITVYQAEVDNLFTDTEAFQKYLFYKNKLLDFITE